MWPCLPTFSHVLWIRYSGKPCLRGRGIPEAQELVNVPLAMPGSPNASTCKLAREPCTRKTRSSTRTSC